MENLKVTVSAVKTYKGPHTRFGYAAFLLKMLFFTEHLKFMNISGVEQERKSENH